jgi:hypothetical protein
MLPNWQLLEGGLLSARSVQGLHASCICNVRATVVTTGLLTPVQQAFGALM